MATVTDVPAEIASPDRLDSEKLYEIIDGQFVEKPSMGSHEHGLASILLEILGPFTRAHGLGQVFTEVLFDLRPAIDRSRRPDVSMVSIKQYPLNRRPPRGVNAAWSVVPDLVVEVSSPSNTADEIIEKMEEYFHAGYPRVWVIYPPVRKVYVYESPTSVRIFAYEDTLEDEGILPGFRLPLAEFFGEEATV